MYFVFVEKKNLMYRDCSIKQNVRKFLVDGRGDLVLKAPGGFERQQIWDGMRLRQ